MKTVRGMILAAALAAPAVVPVVTAAQQGDAGIRVVDELVPVAAVPSPDAVAVVIGNRNYTRKDLPPVKFAIRDAAAMKNLLVHGMGFRPENVIYVEDATSATFNRIFGTAADHRGQLSDYVKPGKSDIFVFYSGHGTPDAKPSSDGKPGRTYFVPSDADPDYIRLAGYPVDQMYENLAKLEAKSVTVVMDACFSGFSDGGALVTDASPAILMVDNPVLAAPGAVAVSASSKNQIASWYPEAEHGLLTYWFLKGMQGEADADKDKVLTAGELETYLDENVKYMARRMRGREQTPQVVALEKERPMIAYSGKTATVTPPAPDRVPVVAAAQPMAGVAAPPTAAPATSAPPAAPARSGGASAAEFLASFVGVLKEGNEALLVPFLAPNTLILKPTRELSEFVRKNKPHEVEVVSLLPGANGESVAQVVMRARGEFGVTNNRQLTVMLPTEQAAMGTIRVVGIAKAK